MVEDREINQLVGLIKNSGYSVVLTGAGMSTESGLLDFRSPAGIWKDQDPRLLASQEALENNYGEFRDFYLCRIEALKKTAPHEGHRVLSRWEKEGFLQAVLTQNVDGFHQEAGSREVMELHGNLRNIICADCNCQSDFKLFEQGLTCPRCAGSLRPGVVLFGEGLPSNQWERALAHLERAEILIIIGTSLEVAPVNQIPLFFRDKGPQVLINKNPTALNNLFDLFIQGSCGEVLSRADEILKKDF